MLRLPPGHWDISHSSIDIDTLVGSKKTYAATVSED
jgi:hypothetical protein